MDAEHLVRICLEAALEPRPDLVLSEPYVPYVPADWNGILVLAEAQNLSRGNQEYAARLRGLPPRERVLRLVQERGAGIGIGP